jgi:peptide/nickel transport system permease protein
LVNAAGDQDFIVAARSVGGSRWHVLSWHLLPHLSRPLASLAASTIASVVALEAALSLIGLALPNHASWGRALVASNQIGGATAVIPGLCAMASLLALAGASVVLARQVRRDRWVEQRLV